MLLRAENLSKSYGAKAVLKGASFSVDSGELVSIVGSSGEGKSTIARILCGTVRPDGGAVYLEGRILLSEKTVFPADRRRMLQLIPQQPYASLDPVQRIGDAIAEPLLYHRLAASKAEAKKQAEALLERVHLSAALYERRPAELSGGQAQRVLIARALGVRPRLLIADEATSMLDISSQAQIIHILRHLIVEDGLAVLLISHDRPLVESVSDRVYRLRQGVLTPELLKGIDFDEKTSQHSDLHGHHHDHDHGRVFQSADRA